MNLEELRLAHPDLCAALVEEGRSAGFKAGAAAETQRIKDVEAQTISGHEALISTLKFDGKTTGPEAAVQVLAAEKELQTKHAKDMISGAPSAVDFSAAPSDQPNDEPAANLSFEETVQAEWDKDASLKAEFVKFETYLAFRKADASGRVKVLGKTK